MNICIALHSISEVSPCIFLPITTTRIKMVRTKTSNSSISQNIIDSTSGHLLSNLISSTVYIINVAVENSRSTTIAYVASSIVGVRASFIANNFDD